MSGTKPPYKVPSMKEIESIPWNGYNVVSTFSGGGGSCLGYRMAGYHVIYANEFVEEAQKTYRLNHPNTYLDTRDIRTVTGEDILKITGKKKGEIDLFDGSPPCCAFSTMGKREKGWNQVRDYSDGKKQRIEDLFFEYTRLIGDLQPKTFVAENVSGLVKGTAIGYFKLIFRELESKGYNVSAKLLNAKYLGVPQARERLIFVGVRKDLGLMPVHPKPLPYSYTIKDALEGIDMNTMEARRLVEDWKGYSVTNLIQKVPFNPDKVGRLCNLEETKGSYYSYSRLSLNQASPTVTASSPCLFHPLANRPLTIDEVKRITSLPDDFIATGTYTQQWERCGRMVPPIMMMNIAKTIQTEILDKLRDKDA